MHVSPKTHSPRSAYRKHIVEQAVTVGAALVPIAVARASVDVLALAPEEVFTTMHKFCDLHTINGLSLERSSRLS